MFVYNVNIMEKLKAAGYNPARLRKEKILSEQTIQNIRNGEMIGIKSLDRICEILKCQPTRSRMTIHGTEAEQPYIFTCSRKFKFRA